MKFTGVGRGIRSAIAVVAVFAYASGASANVGQAYGFGSRNSGLAGAGAAWGFDAFASYLNPAALAADRETNLRLSVGTLYMQPVFKDITGVVIENEYVSDKSPPRTGDVDTDYRATFGQTIGASLTLFPEFYNLSAGVTIFLPILSLAYIDTGEPFIPEYFLYRSRTQRPQVDLGFGARLSSNFHAGVGAHLGFSLSSNASVFLQTNSTKVSTMRFTTSMKPKLGPYFGLYYGGSRSYPTVVPEGEEPPTLFGRDWSAGLVVRLPLDSPNFMTLNSGARAFGDFAALDFIFKATSTLYYDPLSVEAAFSISPADDHRTTLQVDYQRWSAFEAPALSIVDPEVEDCTASDCGVEVTPSNNPDFDYRDIVVPRVAHEWEVSEKTTLRAGYAFRPSIIDGVPNGAGNYLDPSKHVFTAGAGFGFSKLMGTAVDWRLDLHAAWHLLLTQTIEKTPGNEIGDSGDQKIGAPGYEAGGNVFGGGASISFAF